MTEKCRAANTYAEYYSALPEQGLLPLVKLLELWSVPLDKVLNQPAAQSKPQ